MRTRRLSLLLSLVTLATMLAPAGADLGRSGPGLPAGKPSHVPISPRGGSGPGPHELLEQRLQAMKLARDILKNPERLPPEELARLKDLLRGSGQPMPSLNDPRLREFLNKIQEQNKASTAPTEVRVRPAPGPLRDTPAVPRAFAAEVKPPHEPPPSERRGQRQRTSQFDAPVMPDKPPNESEKQATNSGSFDFAGASGQADKPGPFADKLLDFANRLKGMDRTLSNSEALSKAIRDLSQAGSSEDEGWNEMVRKAGDWSQQLRDRIAAANTEGGNSFIDRLGNAMPKMNVNWSGGARRESAAPSMPQFGRPELSGDTSAWGWLGVLVLPAAAFLVWRLVSRSRAVRQDGPGSGWRLGPWPVNPAEIYTRQEVVQAFEYLSLLRLGPLARHRNHHDLAALLAAQAEPRPLPAVERERAAAGLAAVYEKARYAPESDPIPDDALAAAGRDLRRLVGVAAS